ncbi:MAG: thioredoxin family protein [Ignavibacteriaceae bacterium]
MDNYMHKDIESVEELEKFVKDNPGAVAYFSTPSCNVCKVLKPKLIDLLKTKFPSMTFAYVDCDKSKELAAQNNIFTVPTILFFLDGKEIIRKSRNISLIELEKGLSRPYSLFFS